MGARKSSNALAATCPLIIYPKIPVPTQSSMPPPSSPTLILPELSPAARAAFGTTGRLLSCLVIESLARGIYLSIPPLDGIPGGISGICVVLQADVSARTPRDLTAAYKADNILAIVPLHHVPILKHDGADPRGPEIGLLDITDMVPLVLEFADGTDAEPHLNEHAILTAAILEAIAGPGWDFSMAPTLVPSHTPLRLWEAFGRSLNIKETKINEIAAGLESSVLWQKHTFENPPVAPQFSSPSIEWEQSIVEGHPTHPMYKARQFPPPLPDFAPGTYDFHRTTLRFVGFPRANLQITGDFERYAAPLVAAASVSAGEDMAVPETFVAVPVHELQTANIAAKFPDAVIFPAAFSVPILGQLSIRSFLAPTAFTELSLKVGLGIKLIGAVRTITPVAAHFVPRFSALIVPALKMDHRIVTVARELASVVHTHPDVEIAGHCTAVIREAHDSTSEERGERLIVCSALSERGHAGEGGHLPAVVRVFDLDTEAKRLEWLDTYIKLFFEAFLPPMLENGVAFECHPQNSVARFDLKTKELIGFVIRDMEGLRLHAPTLRSSTGIELDLVPHHVVAETHELYAQMYDTGIRNHLQQLIRALGVHYSGGGWALVRRQLQTLIPREHALYDAWLAPESRTFSGKCFMRMCMMDFDVHYMPVSNIIKYEGEGA
ncbi:IucC family-domain-containing protein [Mycena crocata]|nr:IucC family-domain-containing protein [Mycena crocata]